MDFPYYRHDAGKGEGWKELGTPIITYLNETEPFKVQIGGSTRASRLGIAQDGSFILPTRAGIMRSRDHGTSWIRIDGEGKETRASFNTGYSDNPGAIDFDPMNPSRISFMFMRGTAYFSNGSTWTNIGEQFFDFASVDWTTPNPQLMVGVNHGGWDMTISRDGGKTWSYNTAAKLTGTPELSEGMGNGMITVIDANTVIYNNVSGPDRPSGLFRSTDKGATWTKLREGISGIGSLGKAIGDGRVYFVGGGNLWISRDKGATWTSRPCQTANQGPFLSGDWSNGKVGGILIANSDKVSYSKDEGASWISLIGGNSGQSFPPKSTRETDNGIYTANGSNWVYNQDNCDYKYGGSWQYDQVNNVVYASTSAGPVIFKKLSGAGPGPEAAPVPVGIPTAAKTPIPASLASSLVQINRQGILIDAAMNASRVNIVDLFGKTVTSRTLTPGLGSRIGFDGLQPGIYMVAIFADGIKVFSTKTVVVGNR